MRERVLAVRKFNVILLVLLLFLTTGCESVEAKKPDTKVHSMSTDQNDQADIALTVYNVNLGLVKDVRDIKLARGLSELRFMDVASGIIPTSVYIRSLKNPDSLSILEQNYEYDLLNPKKLLDKYVGKTVKLYNMNPYTEREQLVEATVLSNNGQPIFRIGDEITYGYPGRIIFPGVPDDLIPKPTLVWLLENDLLSTQKVEASYLTNGINWLADYVVTLNDRDDKAGLSGWVTIDNRSGATYRDAKLKLVAGDVNRAGSDVGYRQKMMKYALAEVDSAREQFTEDAFFEYHIYTLQRPSTIKNNQTKQIKLVTDRKSTRLNSSHIPLSRMPSSA